MRDTSRCRCGFRRLLCRAAPPRMRLFRSDAVGNRVLCSARLRGLLATPSPNGDPCMAESQIPPRSLDTSSIFKVLSTSGPPPRQRGVRKSVEEVSAVGTWVGSWSLGFFISGYPQLGIETQHAAAIRDAKSLVVVQTWSSCCGGCWMGFCCFPLPRLSSERNSTATFSRSLSRRQLGPRSRAIQTTWM